MNYDYLITEPAYLFLLQTLEIKKVLFYELSIGERKLEFIDSSRQPNTK